MIILSPYSHHYDALVRAQQLIISQHEPEVKKRKEKTWTGAASFTVWLFQKLLLPFHATIQTERHVSHSSTVPHMHLRVTLWPSPISPPNPNVWNLKWKLRRYSFSVFLVLYFCFYLVNYCFHKHRNSHHVPNLMFWTKTLHHQCSERQWES